MFIGDRLIIRVSEMGGDCRDLDKICVIEGGVIN